MLIGLMADSHDRVPAIRELLERMIERGAGMVLHAGDYCSPFSLAPFLGLDQQMRVELLPGGVSRNRHHEVPPRVPHQPFHLPLVIALTRTSELLREQVMALQFGERSCFQPRPIAQDPRYRQPSVVV